jgi:hypothetical protein
MSARAAASNAATSVTASASSTFTPCQAWSSHAAARYSLVANPWLKASEACRLSTTSAGGSPVSMCRAYEESTSGQRIHISFT